VLNKINRIEQNLVILGHAANKSEGGQQQESGPATSNQNPRNPPKPKFQQQQMEVSGGSEYLQGQKLPGVFKQQAKHLDKIKEDKNKLKDHYSNV